MSLTVQNLIDKGKGSIWALNNSHTVVKPGGDVFISVNSKDGMNRVVTVPKTWLPIELTSIVPRDLLLNSSFFLEAVSKGLVKLIDQSEAEKILSKPGADREKSKLQEKADAVKKAVSNRGSLSKNVSVSGGRDSDEDDEEEDSKSRKIKSKGVSVIGMDDDEEEGEVLPDASFRAWVNKLNTLDEQDAISEIKSRGNIEIEEAQYLIVKCKHPKIVKWISSKIED